jgi:hypothetical protein
VLRDLNKKFRLGVIVDLSEPLRRRLNVEGDNGCDFDFSHHGLL